MERFYKKDFTFNSFRYEEYQDGKCISRGAIGTQILAKVYPNPTFGNEIHFRLIDKGDLDIVDKFTFFCIDDAALAAPDRISYHALSDFNPTIPCVCQLFITNDNLLRVRFAMTNPDRLIEFYGVENPFMSPFFNFLI